MPIYEYVCETCKSKFEKLVRSMNSTEAAACPKCGGAKTNRQFSSFAVGAGQSSSPSTGGHGGGCACCSAAPSCPNRAD